MPLAPEFATTIYVNIFKMSDFIAENADIVVFEPDRDLRKTMAETYMRYVGDRLANSRVFPSMSQSDTWISNPERVFNELDRIVEAANSGRKQVILLNTDLGHDDKWDHVNDFPGIYDSIAGAISDGEIISAENVVIIVSGNRKGSGYDALHNDPKSPDYDKSKPVFIFSPILEKTDFLHSGQLKEIIEAYI
jgi:hypothetical protein